MLFRRGPLSHQEKTAETKLDLLITRGHVGSLNKSSQKLITNLGICKPFPYMGQRDINNRNLYAIPKEFCVSSYVIRNPLLSCCDPFNPGPAWDVPEMWHVPLHRIIVNTLSTIVLVNSHDAPHSAVVSLL
ncbi:hypothetical protein VNO77_18169 [Canavalia gladiata]|uniref:Uncharacterized protein n=1 Tax=Canavalia gladiata TaxID=3824 RepID=A0AAN9LKC0_CANGL